MGGPWRKNLAPDDLANALGADTISALTQQTGLARDDAAGLSQNLPDFVDQLTPEGHLPTDEEAPLVGPASDARQAPHGHTGRAAVRPSPIFFFLVLLLVVFAIACSSCPPPNLPPPNLSSSMSTPTLVR
jgi:hypothetical protein